MLYRGVVVGERGTGTGPYGVTRSTCPPFTYTRASSTTLTRVASPDESCSACEHGVGRSTNSSRAHSCAWDASSMTVVRLQLSMRRSCHTVSGKWAPATHVKRAPAMELLEKRQTGITFSAWLGSARDSVGHEAEARLGADASTGRAATHCDAVVSHATRANCNNKPRTRYKRPSMLTKNAVGDCMTVHTIRIVLK